jgi:hypothetical protein
VLREVFVLRSTEILPAFLVLFVSASTVALFDTEPGRALFFNSDLAVLSETGKTPASA